MLTPGIKIGKLLKNKVHIINVLTYAYYIFCIFKLYINI